MRLTAILAALLMLSACQDEPDFDTRYDAATKEIEARASAMDESIKRGASEEQEGEAARAPDEPQSGKNRAGAYPSPAK